MRALGMFLIVLSMVFVGGVAQAQPYNQPNRPVVLSDVKGSVPDDVAGIRLRKPAPPAVIPLRQVELPETQGSVLPFTGAELTAFAALGLAAIGGGSLMVRRTRRAAL